MCIRVVRYAKRHVAPLFQVPAPDGSGEMVQGEAVSMGRSVLAVFQRGQQIWSCAAAAQVCYIAMHQTSMPARLFTLHVCPALSFHALNAAVDDHARTT